MQVNRYDAEGLRHEMEENGRLVRFICHKGEAVAEQEENSNVIRLIRGSELIARSSDSESARTYYHYASDEMGSTTHIVDDNGNVQNRYAYDAWGRITVREEAVPNRFTYYGQQIDPITQQYYLRARFYNPVIGRFTQEDIYQYDGLNLYTYCGNNPIIYQDPSGNKFLGYKDALTNKQQLQLLNELDASHLSPELKQFIRGQIEDASGCRISNPIHKVTDYYRNLIEKSVAINGRIDEINEVDLKILSILNSDTTGIHFSDKGHISPHILIGTIRDESGRVIAPVEFYNSRAVGDVFSLYESRRNPQAPIYHTESKMLQDLKRGVFGTANGRGIVHMIGYNPCCDRCTNKIQSFIRGVWAPVQTQEFPLPDQYRFTQFLYWDINNDTVSMKWNS